MDANYYKKYEPLFGEWQIRQQIGEGSYGRVFIIEKHESGQICRAALKTITVPGSRTEIKSLMSDGMNLEDVAGYYKKVADDIIGEFMLMSKLRGSRYVVSYEEQMIIEHEDHIGRDILIRMELLTPLVDITAKSQMDETEIIKLGTDLCRALKLCRVHGIVHRDIKPENIFVSAAGNYKIGDFGVAKIVDKTKAGLSRKGTHMYMAPEVYSGRPYGATVDIYSLGIVMYKLLNKNRLPFMPKFPETITPVDKEEALYKRLRGDEIPEPQNGSRRLKQIVLKACSYSAADRYSTAEEMLKELETLFCKAEDDYITESAKTAEPKRQERSVRRSVANIRENIRTVLQR